MSDTPRPLGQTTLELNLCIRRAAFKKALVPVHKEMSERIFESLIKEVYAATGFKPD